MRVRILTFRYSPTLGAFDDAPLRELLRENELVTLREQFFRVNGVPHLCCVVTYHAPEVPRETRPEPAAAPAARRPGRPSGWRGKPAWNCAESPNGGSPAHVRTLPWVQRRAEHAVPE